MRPHRRLFKSLLPSSGGLRQGAELLSHIKIPHTWRFEETPRRLPRRPRHPTFPPTGHEGPAAPRPRPRRSLSVRFHASPAKGCPVGAQRGADMRAPRDRRRRASSHRLRGHLSIFFGETSIEALRPFLIGLFPFGCRVLGALYAHPSGCRSHQIRRFPNISSHSTDGLSLCWLCPSRLGSF